MTHFTGENGSARRKSIPQSLFYGVLLITGLYVGVNAALIHALGVSGMHGSPLLFTSVLAHFGGGIPSTLFALDAMITGELLQRHASAPRVIMALAQDGLLPRTFAVVNKGGVRNAFLLTAIGSLGAGDACVGVRTDCHARHGGGRSDRSVLFRAALANLT